MDPPNQIDKLGTPGKHGKRSKLMFDKLDISDKLGTPCKRGKLSKLGK